MGAPGPCGLGGRELETQAGTGAEEDREPWPAEGGSPGPVPGRQGGERPPGQRSVRMHALSGSFVDTPGEEAIQDGGGPDL